VVPLIRPIAAAYGIAPVHLGTVFLANMESGYPTPLMGENLLLASFRSEKSLGRIDLSRLPCCLMLVPAGTNP
jgi:C4-dicarboxylate transporter, DctM subunit